MSHEKVWKKVLGSDEEVKYEFSVGRRYRTFMLILWGILSVLLLPAAGLGLLVFLIAFIYWWFYIPVANAYAFTNKRVLIHKGWLSTKLISVEYSKITDAHVEEPFLDRIFTKSGNLAINTAGTSAKEIDLKHVEFPYEVKKKLDEFSQGAVSKIAAV